jgi:hypothetical protein
MRAGLEGSAQRGVGGRVLANLMVEAIEDFLRLHGWKAA